MGIPKPPVPLEAICSVIYNNTLFTYSSGAFQALPLASGARWAELSKGVSVEGAVCVGTTPKDTNQAAFFVVGGWTPDSKYQGLQKYTYSTGKWESIALDSAVTQNRKWHGAAYINSTDSILIYAGNQDGVQLPSSQTFTIGASAPHTVLAYESIAPPAVSPMLLPWSENEVALIGGDPSNKMVMLFNPEQRRWVDSGASLAAPLPKNSSCITAAIVRGDDGCRNLYTFDMTVAPNQANRTLLTDGTGRPIPNAPSVTARSLPRDAGLQRRAAHTFDDWPEYNSTLAPKTVRTNYAVATDSTGVAVFAGGNPDDVLCIFDGRENQWQNATRRLVDQDVLSITEVPGSASSSTPSSTAPESPAASTDAAAAATGGQSGGASVSTILAATLGSIIGLALVLVLALLWIRHKKQGRTSPPPPSYRDLSPSSSDRGGYGFAFNEKKGEKHDSPGSQDHLNASLPGDGFRGHRSQDSGGSYSSMAILMGRVGHQQKSSVTSTPSLAMGGHSRQGSSNEASNKLKSSISKPIIRDPQTAERIPLPPIPTALSNLAPSQADRGVSFATTTDNPSSKPRGLHGDGPGPSTRRSSGWGKYWSGGSALNILGMGASKRTTMASEGGSSTYSDRQTLQQRRRSSNAMAANGGGGHGNRRTQDSATVPPLQVSPPSAAAAAAAAAAFEDGKPRFNRVNSGSPTVSQYSGSHHREGSVARIEQQQQRPVSAASSGYSSGIPASVHEAWDPLALGVGGKQFQQYQQAAQQQKPWGTDRAPSSEYTASIYPTPLAAPSSGSLGSKKPPTGISQQPQLQTATKSSDMSWLNLGGDRSAW